MSDTKLKTDQDKNDIINDIPGPNKEPIYVMTIELDQGKASHLEIYSDSIPEEVSYDFCRKNNLDYQSLNYLKKQIEELINENSPKLSHISSPIPPHPKPNLKEKEEGIQVTPIKSNLFSCESFFISLQERNLTKSNKKTKRNLYIPLIKNHSKTDVSNNHNTYTNENKNKKNKYYTPVQTDSNRYNYHIPHPRYNQKKSSLVQLNHCESEKCSKLSSNYFKDSSSRSISKSNKNIGVKLYEKGNLLLEKKYKKLEELRNKLNIKAGVELTFKPLLNNSFSKKKINPEIKEKIISTKLESFTEINNDRLSSKIHSNEYTSPSLIKIRAPVNTRLNNNSKSNKRLSGKTTKTNNELTYHLHLTDYRLSEKTKLPFSTRLKLFKQQYEENSVKLKNNFNKNIDSKTGQPFFTPALVSKQQKRSKSPLNSHNIFDDLYSYASYYKTNQNKRKEIIDKKINKLNKPKISDNSEEIFQKKKESVFRKIFNILDTDEDGLISIYSLDLNKILNNISMIIMPIIIELKDYQGNINSDDFLVEGLKLFEVSIL